MPKTDVWIELLFCETCGKECEHNSEHIYEHIPEVTDELGLIKTKSVTKICTKCNSITDQWGEENKLEPAIQEA